MPLFSFEGVSPTVHPDAWIAPTATLIGDVHVEAGASVWYGAVLRADFDAIVLREGCNVQDNSVLHGSEIGRNATVGHLCVVHDCVVGEQAVIGNGSTVQDKAVIGARTLLAAGSLVPPGLVVPDDVVAYGSPAKNFRPVSEGAQWWIDNNGPLYVDLARRHAATAHPAD